MPATRHPEIPLPALGELERSGPWQVVRWGAYLGCSWTWVIGMVLPVMLLRDLGVWGWVIFAVPNVLGAAAMGTVLRSAGVSRLLTDRHATALYAFSAVTVGFQFYVVCWLAPGPWVGLLLLPLVGMAVPQARRRIAPWLPALGIAAAVLSWGAFSTAGRLDGAWLDVATNTLSERLPAADLWFLLPGFLTGFALCPYLDPTFHRARQATAPATGRFAFILGFGVVFFSMIVFTLMYSGVLRPLLASADGAAGIAPPWRAILGIHIGLQVFYTVAVHLRELFRDAERRPVATHPAGPRRHVLALLLILPIAFALLGQPHAVTDAGITAGEWGYRLFITVYGVFFPGYVLLCMMPTLRPRTEAFRLQVFWIAAGLGAPLCVMGLITGPMAWLLGLYAVLGAARIVLDVGPWGGAGAERKAKSEKRKF